MSSQKQLAEQAETKGYRNPNRGGKRENAGRKIAEDPAVIVPCSRCMESVMAVRKRYFDTPEQLHRHQPEPQRYKRDDGQAVGV